MHLLWISGKCDACCLSWACYLFLHSSASHPLMSRKETLRKKKFKKWQPRSFNFMLLVVQLLSRVQLFLWPVDCIKLGFPVLHHLPELAQTHVHWVSHAIQPSHPLSIPFSSYLQSSPTSGSSPRSQLFTLGPKYWSFSFSIRSSNDYWELISFRIN